MFEGNLVLFSKEGDYEAWLTCKQLEENLEQMEKRGFYMQGHNDS